MKKTVCAFLAAVIVVSGFAGCGKSEKSSESKLGTAAQSDPVESTGAAPQENVTIKWLHHYGEESVRSWIDEITGNFSKSGGVSFDVQATSYDNYQTLIKTKIASSDAPDFFDLGTTDIPEFTKSNYLEELSGYDFWDKVMDGTKESTQIDGKNYFIPFEPSAAAAFYNKDVFEKAGIAQVPQTYTEFVDVLKKLKESGVAPIAFGSKEWWTIVNDFRADMLAMNLKRDPKWMNKKQSRESKFADDETFIQSLAQFKARYEYGNDDPFGTDWNKATEMVATGKAGMVINGNWAVGAIKEKAADVNLGVFAVPATDNPDDTKLTVWSSSGYVVFADSPAKKQVIDFLNYLFSVESGTLWQEKTLRMTTVKGITGDFDPTLTDIGNYINSGKIFDTTAMQTDFSQEFANAQMDIFTQYLTDQIKDPKEAAVQLDKRFDEIAAKQGT